MNFMKNLAIFFIPVSVDTTEKIKKRPGNVISSSGRISHFEHYAQRTRRVRVFGIVIVSWEI